MRKKQLLRGASSIITLTLEDMIILINETTRFAFVALLNLFSATFNKDFYARKKSKRFNKNPNLVKIKIQGGRNRKMISINRDLMSLDASQLHFYKQHHTGITVQLYC